MNAFDKLVLTVGAALALLIGFVLALGDRIGAPIASISPTDGGAPPVTTVLAIEFGGPMDRASVESRFSIAPETDYELLWEGRTLIVRFPVALTPGETITATLDGGARTGAGRETRPMSWSFTPREPRMMYLSPASGEIRSLWTRSLDEDAPPREIFAPANGVLDYSPAPDGSQAAVTAPRDDGGYAIWMVDIDAAQAEPLLDCAPASCSNPAFSPDGRRIAYERREPDDAGEFSAARIYLLDLEQGGTAPVYAEESLIGFGPVWSPDGGRLAFIDTTRTAIRVVDLETHGAALLNSEMGEVGAFAPDGDQMIYVDLVLIGNQFFTQLFYVDLDGDQGVVNFLADAEEDRGPAWSPQGRWLVFGRRRIDRSEGFGAQIMMLDLETGETRALTDDPAYNNLNFVWDPTGRYLLFNRFKLGADGAAPAVWLYDTADESIRPLIDDALDALWLP